MPLYVLRLEGVDFDATIGDTHNLSAYRGGSLALLAAPIAVGGALEEAKVLKEKIFEGASLGAWIIEADGDSAAETLRCDVREFLRGKPVIFARLSGGISRALAPMKSAEAVWRHLSFVVDVAAVKPANGVEPEFLALKQAEAKNHERQFREANWEPPPFDQRASGAHPKFDRVRPASPDCRIDAQGLTHQAVSPSFKARFEYGREQRQKFYAREAGENKAKGLDFAESFEDIINEAPSGLPASISGKIAVFYADGNQFTKIREKSKSIRELRLFSEKLHRDQCGLLGKILDWLRAGGEGSNSNAYRQYPISKGKAGPFWPLRFETLMWGGDELTFVMPAWLGIDFARLFHEEWTKGWRARGETDGEPLTFGMGLLFCHEKTPIRQARKVAKALAENAKCVLRGCKLEELENVLQIEAFESIALPEYENGLGRYRAALFGLDPAGGADGLAETMTLRGTAIEKALGTIARIKNSGAFPRSQIYRLLWIAKKKGVFRAAAGSEMDQELESEARKYLERMRGRGSPEVEKTLRLLRVLPGGFAYSLAAISSLWD